VRDFLMVGIVAATLGTLLAPFVRRVAARVGFVDRPDRRHKRHGEAVPLGGGLVVFLSVIGALACTAAISTIVRALISQDATLMFGLSLSALLVVVVGLVDDSHGMRGRHKLMGQIAAALLLASQGLEVRQLEIMGATIDLGVLAVPFTVFWLLGAINAVNLLDGIDGLAGTIGLVTSLAVACLAIISGQALAALIAVAIAGGCLAFLHSNLPPAKMFLGDTGSMLLGLSLGALTVMSCSNGPGLLSLAPAVGLLAIPIMDSSVALLRRRLTGRSIYATDRGHLHHCLVHVLKSSRAVLLVAAVACAATGSGAVISVFQKNDLTAIIATLLVMATLVLLRCFGHAEVALLRSKIAIPPIRIGRSGNHQNRNATTREVAVRLQGEREWNVLWESLVECATKLDLTSIDLDVNLPAMKEGFHANWYQHSPREWHECWRMEIPLFAVGSAVGRLQVIGDRWRAEESVCGSVDNLIDLLKPFEKAFAILAGSPEVNCDEWSANENNRLHSSGNDARRFDGVELLCATAAIRAEIGLPS
jgi:UDP-GlcNAc:undecaprenyl-phosphate/decaprenyl-phosphate GlcNAc-1-phosphate transferase